MTAEQHDRIWIQEAKQPQRERACILGACFLVSNFIRRTKAFLGHSDFFYQRRYHEETNQNTFYQALCKLLNSLQLPPFFLFDYMNVMGSHTPPFYHYLTSFIRPHLWSSQPFFEFIYLTILISRLCSIISLNCGNPFFPWTPKPQSGTETASRSQIKHRTLQVIES
jgi:hypothetical protein